MFDYSARPELLKGRVILVTGAGRGIGAAAAKTYAAHGATVLLTGAGGPGGTINMVRKKPTSEFKGYVDLGAGSWDNYRSEIDVSGPLTESGNVRGRAVAAYQDKHTFLDHYQRKTNVYYGILEFDLAPDTLLTIGGDYQDSDPQGSSWSGAASLFDSAGNHISTPRSFNNGAKYSQWKQYTRTAFATLEHTFDNGWVGKAQYNHQINGYKAPLSALLSPNAETGKASLLTRTYNGETTSDTGDLYATGPFSLFGREHELVVGTSVSRSHWLGSDYTNATNYENSHDYFNWDGDALKPDRGPRTKKNDELTRQSASYITGRFSLADDLHLILGTRVNNYEVSGTSQVKDTGKVVPYAGITYDLNDNFSAYASFTEIYLPQDDHTRSTPTKVSIAFPSASSSYPWNSPLYLASSKSSAPAAEPPSIVISGAVFDPPTTSSTPLASPRNVLRSAPFLFLRSTPAHRRYYSSDTILRAAAAPDLRRRRDHHQWVRLAPGI